MYIYIYIYIYIIASFKTAGCWPVSSTIFAAPRTVCVARLSAY